MTARRILYLDTHRLAAYAWQGGRLTAEASFTPSPEDIGRFAAYLESRGPCQYRLLANVGEEGHQVEVIPFLRGRDRQTVIARKTAQLFFGTPLSTAISLGYEKTRRKNERLLLSALTNPAHFEPWLAVLAQAEVPLAGVYTLSQLGGRLLHKLLAPPEHCLLLSMQDDSIRESYLVAGQTVFSRMAPVTDGSNAGIAAAFAAESRKLHQYLVAQRQIGRNDRLPVFVLAHPAACEATRAACVDNGNLAYNVLDSHAAAARIGLRTLPPDNRSEWLFMHLLATHAPRQQFAGEEFRHDYRLHQIKRALLGTGAVALLAALLFSAKQCYEAYMLDRGAAALAAEEIELNRRYEGISATFPKLAIAYDALRQVTTRFGDLRRLQIQPAEAYRLVARALDASPEVELAGLEWKIVSAEAGTAAAGALPAPEAAREAIVVRGTLGLRKEATPRQVLAAFDAFVQRLAANPEVRIEVLQRPVDVEPGSTLKGGGREDDNPQPRGFAIRILRRPAL